jgi:hypothetical protein
VSLGCVDQVARCHTELAQRDPAQIDQLKIHLEGERGMQLAGHSAGGDPLEAALVGNVKEDRFHQGAARCRSGIESRDYSPSFIADRADACVSRGTGIEEVGDISRIMDAMHGPAGSPIDQRHVRDQIQPYDRSGPHGKTSIFVGSNKVDSSYFETMRIPVLRGRPFGPQDRDGAPVAIVNEILARRFWPNQEPVGKRIQELDGRTLEVIGIAKTCKYDSLGEKDVPFVYFSLDQSDGYSGELTFHVRTGISSKPLLDTFRRQLVALNPALTVFDVETMDEHLADSLLLVRMGAILLSTFGGLTLALASLGLYGSMEYFVRQRTRKMGIRMALGANPSDLLKLVLKQGMRLTLSGIAVGAAFGSGISVLIASQLYGVTKVDLATLAGVVSLQFGIALLACWFPARRALYVEPMMALRYE